MKKAFIAVAAILALLPVLSLITFGEKPASGEVDIYLISNEIHVGIAVPKKNHIFDWDTFLPEKIENSDWVEFGWGDRRFYFEMPTWEQFTLELAADALFIPDPAVMHVEYLLYSPDEKKEYIRKISVSKETYQKLITELKSWFVLKNGIPILIKGKGYGPNDFFFEAKGSYSLVKTCNQWTADVLGEAGLKHPLWSPTRYGIERIYE